MSHSTEAHEAGAQAGTTVEDLKALLREAEEALGGAENAASEEIQALRERLRDVLADGKSTLRQFSDSVRRQAARADEVVRTNPYQTIGVAAAVGLLVGFLISRSHGGDKS
jgi:ElaB/YqjD/DUF883 family membrane-anchored ribosome-binding protein